VTLLALLRLLLLLLLTKDAAMAPSQRDAQRNYQPSSVARKLPILGLLTL